MTWWQIIIAVWPFAAIATALTFGRLASKNLEE